MSNDHDGTDGPEGTAEADPTAAVPSATPLSDAAPIADPAGDELLDDANDSADGDTADESAADLSLGSDADDEGDDDGSDRALVGAGVVAAGSARAAARRSAAVRAGVTEKKGRATAARDIDRGDKENVFARLLRFLREVVAELRKVIWPGRNQMVVYTTVVIIFVVFMVALVYGLDVGFAKLVLAVFG
ncbi:MAG: preprotein translocase subunit SecE [Actinomycetota bacterium]|nr:preprotein translocase subunit SecE [Actinomycetota bacterium]